MKINSSKVLHLFPVPKILDYESEYTVELDILQYIKCNRTERDSIIRNMNKVLHLNPIERQDATCTFQYVEDFKEQEYDILIEDEKILIQYHSEVGIYYALGDLSQIKRQFGKLCKLHIRNYPSIDKRGYLLDISRNKVPKLEILKEIVSMLSRLRFNEFQLYIEGRSFAYENIKYEESGLDCISEQEIKELDEFCKVNYIELIANQNCLGHMEDWLSQQKFKKLAERPRGGKLYGIPMPPNTLDCKDRNSLEFVESLLDGLLPAFSSNVVNVNLDEPFELGKGKNKRKVKKSSKSQLYLEYIKELQGVIKKKNKTMMMYSDVITHYPECIEQLPEEIRLVEWGYEDIFPFEARAKLLSQAKNPFYLLAGTSGWNSILGRTQCMEGNIKNAVSVAKKYKAMGVMLSDWGDFGHWQSRYITYLPLSYLGGLSWNSDATSIMDCLAYLDREVFECSKGSFATILYELGRYEQFEPYRQFNKTMTAFSLQTIRFGLVNRKVFHSLMHYLHKVTIEDADVLGIEVQKELLLREKQAKPYDFEGLNYFLTEHEELLDQLECTRKQLTYEKECIKNGINLVHIGSKLIYFIEKEPNMNIEEKKTFLKEYLEQIVRVRTEFEALWLIENKPKGLTPSTHVLYQLEKEIDRIVKSLDHKTKYSWYRMKQAVMGIVMENILFR